MTTCETTGILSSVLLMPNQSKHIEFIELRRIFNREK